MSLLCNPIKSVSKVLAVLLDKEYVLNVVGVFFVCFCIFYLSTVKEKQAIMCGFMLYLISRSQGTEEK